MNLADQTRATRANVETSIADLEAKLPTLAPDAAAAASSLLATLQRTRDGLVNLEASLRKAAP